MYIFCFAERINPITVRYAADTDAVADGGSAVYPDAATDGNLNDDANIDKAAILVI